MSERHRASPGRGFELVNITKLFWGAEGVTTALENVSLQVGEGEFISLVGPSGCGKTTLLRVAAGLLPPDAGSVRIDGAALSGTHPNAGMVFQSDVLLEWRSALDNVLLTAEARGLPSRQMRAEARELLGSVGLGGFLASLPHELSGGMRQRVAICRALLGSPDILFMDEPFGALDALTREQLGRDLQRLWLSYRRPVLFVTHNVDEAVFLSDRVVVMSPRPGKITDIVAVDLPRPRELSMMGEQPFRECVQRIRARLEHNEVSATAGSA